MSNGKLTKSELEVGAKIDRCLQDALIKVGSGIGLGIVFSVVLFKRRPWPVLFGSGVGLGMAYSNCQHDLQTPFLPSAVDSIIKVTDSKVVEDLLKNVKK